MAWPSQMHELAREEAGHHDHDTSDAEQVHQLNQPRNLFYHEIVWQELRALPRGSRLLEIGAGSGFDALKLCDDYHLILSDVSFGTLDRLCSKLADHRVDYVSADGAHLPFADASVAAIYMFATLHHLPDPGHGISEWARVIEPGGRLIIGMEPNRFYFLPIKLSRNFLCRLTHMDPKDGSRADAQMEGFSFSKLKLLFQTGQWENVRIRPVWLFAGFWHYMAEFLFRSLKLKKRLALPASVENALIKFDEILFKIPGIKRIGWHWIITAKRRV